jgi:DNA-binding transcriptional MerR regulator
VRVKELADLTGTTVRTVRYYHEIGLLPIPGERDGRRDYDLLHVARVTRIRWLAQAGVPLSRMAGLLSSTEPGSTAGHPAAGFAEGAADDAESRAAQRAAIRTDLEATVLALEDQLTKVRAQLEQVRRLMRSLENDDQLSPMPPAVARFYDDMERRIDDEAVRRVIRRERDFMELAFYRGDMPREVEVVYAGFDEARLADSAAVFGQVAGRSNGEQQPTATEIDQVAAAIVERLRRHLGPELARVARSIDPAVARRAADLYLRLADDAERPLSRAAAEAVLGLLEEGRSR